MTSVSPQNPRLDTYADYYEANIINARKLKRVHAVVISLSVVTVVTCAVVIPCVVILNSPKGSPGLPPLWAVMSQMPPPYLHARGITFFRPYFDQPTMNGMRPSLPVAVSPTPAKIVALSEPIMTSSLSSSSDTSLTVQQVSVSYVQSSDGSTVTTQPLIPTQIDNNTEQTTSTTSAQSQFSSSPSISVSSVITTTNMSPITTVVNSSQRTSFLARFLLIATSSTSFSPSTLSTMTTPLLIPTQIDNNTKQTTSTTSAQRQFSSSPSSSPITTVMKSSKRTSLLTATSSTLFLPSTSSVAITKAKSTAAKGLYQRPGFDWVVRGFEDDLIDQFKRK